MNVLINSKNVIAHGSILCTKDIVFIDDVQQCNIPLNKDIISYDIISEGNIIFDGKLYIVLPDMISKYASSLLSSNKDVLGNIYKSFLDDKLYEKFNVKDLKIIESENIYLIVNNVKIGYDLVAYFNFDKSKLRKIKISNLRGNM